MFVSHVFDETLQLDCIGARRVSTLKLAIRREIVSFEMRHVLMTSWYNRLHTVIKTTCAWTEVILVWKDIDIEGVEVGVYMQNTRPQCINVLVRMASLCRSIGNCCNPNRGVGVIPKNNIQISWL